MPALPADPAVAEQPRGSASTADLTRRAGTAVTAVAEQEPARPTGSAGAVGAVGAIADQWAPEQRLGGRIDQPQQLSQG